MKKLFSLLALGAMFAATSCSNDDALLTSDSSDDNISTVTFSVQQPGSVQSRSFGDGTTATTLYYAVYQVGDDGLTYRNSILDLNTNDTDGCIENAFDGTSLETTISLQLVNGNEYDIVFWAQSPDADIYTVELNSTEPSVTIETAQLTSSVEDYDAFYKFHEVGVVTADISETIILTRPLAQLNWGTDDLEAVKAADVTDLQTKLTISASGVGNKLTFATGEVEYEEEEVVYAAADIPEEDDGTFPVTYTVTTTDDDGNESTTTKAYNYINMCYILFAADKAEVDATLTVTGENLGKHEVIVSHVPLQRNYRTNIYGSLLTSTVDYTIEIKPQFEYEEEEGDSDYNINYTTVSTLEGLIEALGDEDIDYVALTTDLDATGQTLSSSGKKTLYTNGYTLTATNISYTGTLTITGETIEEAGSSSELKTRTTGERGKLILTTSYQGIQSTAGNDSITIKDLDIVASNANMAICTGATDGSSSGDVITLSNVSITCKKTGLCVYGYDNVVNIDNCEIEHGYFGITQQGTNSPGTTFNITNTTISGTYSGIYLSSNASAAQNTLNVDGCTITSNEESAIEVRNTNITVANSTLMSKATTQKYSYSGSGSNGYGFGVMLAATAGLSTTSYQGTVSLSNITYTLSATANPDGGDTPWNACYYNGSAAAQYEDDGAVTAEEEEEE